MLLEKKNDTKTFCLNTLKIICNQNFFVTVKCKKKTWFCRFQAFTLHWFYKNLIILKSWVFSNWLTQQAWNLFILLVLELKPLIFLSLTRLKNKGLKLIFAHLSNIFNIGQVKWLKCYISNVNNYVFKMDKLNFWVDQFWSAE